MSSLSAPFMKTNLYGLLALLILCSATTPSMYGRVMTTTPGTSDVRTLSESDGCDDDDDDDDDDHVE